MSPFAQRLLLSLPAGLALLAAAAPAAHSQYQAPLPGFRVTPTPAYPAPYDTGAAWGTGYSPGLGFRLPPPVLPYYPGVYNIYPDPYGGGLTGAANAIAAQGQFEVDYQKSRLLGQEVERSKIDTRHRQWEEWLYEREHRPTIEDERERQRIENLRRARNNPPFAEIWSGQALNNLLLAAEQQQSRSGPGPAIPLDDDVLAHLNVTSGTMPGGVGLLKDAGRLHWPLVLQRAAFADGRKRVDQLLAQAVQQARSGSVDADTLDQLNQTIGGLRASVKSRLDDITASDDIRAKRFLNDLSTAVKALEDPDVAKYLSGKWAARGQTIGDLVTSMARQGLKFAPAVGGDEAAYNALHRALVDYTAPPNPAQPWDAMSK